MTIAAASQGRFGAAFEWLGVERAWTRTRGNPEVVIGIVDEGPGTDAAGIAAGSQSDIESFSGIAPASSILPVRFTTGTGTQALNLAQAIEFAVEMGACIINISHAAELASSPVLRAIQYAATRNVLVVSTASEQRGKVDAVPNQLHVLSIDERFQPLAECPREIAHLAAPGFAPVANGRGIGHHVLTGAAMGAPYVSGCAALLKALNPGWGYHELKEHLLASCTPRPELVGKCQADGVLNVANAVLGPIESAGEVKSLTWSSLNDAVLEWKLRYRSGLCAHAVALYRPQGDEHWRELAFERVGALKMIIPAHALRRSSGTLRIACRESNFHSEELALTIL